jgi:hypothetical protein
MVFGIIPECRSASFRNERSASPESSQMKLVATSVTEVDLKDTGHWLMEERPEETIDALIAFL